MVNESECHVLHSVDQAKYISGWRGIPEVIVFHGILASLFILVLTCLRVFYHWRKPHYNDWDISWLQFIYGDRPASMLCAPIRIRLDHANSYLPPELWPHTDDPDGHLKQGDNCRQLMGAHTEVEKRRLALHQASLDNLGRTRFWLWDYLFIPPEVICRDRGIDVANYLLCQRYLLYYMIILSAFSLLIILPVNVLGGTMARDAFEQTTINAHKGTSELLWIHASVTVLLVIIGVLMMLLFWCQLPMCTVCHDTHTLLIENVAESKRDVGVLRRYLEHRFARAQVKVTRVTLTYDVKELANLKIKMKVVEEGLRYAHAYQRHHGERLQVRPGCCGQFCFSLCCCCGHEPRDAIEYYQEEIVKVGEELKQEVRNVWRNPQHAVFVQFQNEEMAKRVLNHFEKTMPLRTCRHDTLFCCFCSCCCCSVEEDTFGYLNWNVTLAPMPEDILWRDIIMDTRLAGVIAFFLTILLLVIFVFITTPLVIFDRLRLYLVKIGLAHESSEELPAAGTWAWCKWQLAENASLLLFLIFEYLIPQVVIYIQSGVPRRSQPIKDQALLKTSFLIIFLVEYLAPSFGLISIQMLIRDWATDAHFQSLRLYRCLFPVGNAVWFFKLIILATFVDTMADLLRLGDLLPYLFNCLLSPRTEAEYLYARLETLPLEYNFTSSYTRDLIIFTIAVIYSVSCPLIAPAGLLYFIVRHLADRYTLYYLNSVSRRIPWRTHQTVVFIVLLAFFFFLLHMTAFLETQGEWGWAPDPAGILFIFLIIYILFLFMGTWCIFGAGTNRASTGTNAGNGRQPGQGSRRADTKRTKNTKTSRGAKSRHSGGKTFKKSKKSQRSRKSGKSRRNKSQR